MSDKEKKICEHDCDCGCDCEDGEGIVELVTDNGQKLKFYFVGSIEYKGKTYSAFEPAEEIEGLSEDDLVIFEVAEGDGEEEELLPIEDDALLDEVFEEFCKELDEEEGFEEE